MDKLIKCAKKGDKKSIETIIKKYEKYIFKESNKIKLKDYSKEDLIQQGKLSIIKAINNYNIQSKTNFTSYVITAIKNNYYNKIRKECKNRFDISLNSKNKQGIEHIELYPCNYSIEDELVKKESINKLNKALGKLSSKERKLIEWVYYKRNKIKDYSRINNISYSTCIKKKKRILEKLKKNMEDKK